jgi:hypothetical protein
MEYGKEKVDEMVLALMFLVMHGDKYGMRAWKGFDWDTLDRLHEKSLISDPKSKAKSVALSDKAVKLSDSLFEKHFGTKAQGGIGLVDENAPITSPFYFTLCPSIRPPRSFILRRLGVR